MVPSTFETNPEHERHMHIALYLASHKPKMIGAQATHNIFAACCIRLKLIAYDFLDGTRKF